MKFNLLPVILILPFLTACPSSLPSVGGPPQGPTPLDKAQKTSFGSFLKETNKAPGIVSLMMSGKLSNSSDEFETLLGQEMREGKCKFNSEPQDAPQGESIIENSISGDKCSFEISLSLKMAVTSETQQTVAGKLSFTIHSPEQVLPKNEILSQEFDFTSTTDKPDETSVSKAVAVKVKMQTRSYGTVEQAFDMTTTQTADEENKKVAIATDIRSTYVSKSWNATLVKITKPGAKLLVTLNGEPADLEIIREFNKWLGSIDSTSPPGR